MLLHFSVLLFDVIAISAHLDPDARADGGYAVVRAAVILSAGFSVNDDTITVVKCKSEASMGTTRNREVSKGKDAEGLRAGVRRERFLKLAAERRKTPR